MTAPRRPRSAWLLVLDAVGVDEGPERGPAVEEVLGELPVVLGSRALAIRVLEQRAELVLKRRGLSLETSPVAVLLVDVPGGEEVVCDPEAAVSELFLVGHAFAVGGEVSLQVGPAELPVGGVEVVVAAPAVRADDPGEARAEQHPGLGRVAARRDPEHGGSAGQRGPQRPPAAGGLPTGLVDIDHRRRLDALLELRVRPGERLAGTGDDRLDRPGR